MDVFVKRVTRLMLGDGSTTSLSARLWVEIRRFRSRYENGKGLRFAENRRP